LPPPDAARQQNDLTNIQLYVSQHFNRETKFNCAQTPDVSNSRTVTIELSIGGAPHQGATTGVDTASLLQEVFAPSSGTVFEFDHYGNLQGQTMAVYRYSYTVNGSARAGTIFANETTGAVLRMTFRGTGTAAHLFCLAQQ
jgi:hypothetical protein